MIIEVDNNYIFVADDEKSLILKASLTFERVYELLKPEEVGIVPMFRIYATGVDGSEEKSKMYVEFYKELLLVMSALIDKVYYINTFEDSELIYTLQESVLQFEGSSPTKIPTKTSMKIHK